MEIGENISFGADGVGRGVLNHYKHDSKAHPPFVRPRRLAYMHIQLLGVQAKHDNAYASGTFQIICHPQFHISTQGNTTILTMPRQESM